MFKKIIFSFCLFLISIVVFFVISAQPTLAIEATCCTCSEKDGNNFETFACMEGRHSCRHVCERAGIQENENWEDFTSAMSADGEQRYAQGENITCCECAPMAGSGYRYHCQIGNQVCEQRLPDPGGWIGVCKPPSLGNLTETGKWGKWLESSINGPNVILARPEETTTPTSAPEEKAATQKSSKTKAIPIQGIDLPTPLGTTSIPMIVGRIIKAILGIVGSIALLMFIYGGFLWLMSRGNTEMVTKGKNVLIYATIGLVIIFISYALVNFVINSLVGVGG